MILRKFSDLWLLVLFTLAATAVVLAARYNAFRVVFALPLMFVLPGYAIIAALFARRALPLETHLVFAVAMSVAVTVLGGFFLHFTPWGLQTQAWLFLLVGISLFASAIAMIRRSFSPSFVNAELYLKFNLTQLIMFGLAVVLVFSAVAVARNGILTQPQPGFTQLWLLPSPDSPDVVRVGIRNEEATTTSYRLIVNYGNTVLGEWDLIELAPGEEWQREIDAGNIAIQPEADSVDVWLYREVSPDTIYRRASLALSTASSANP